MYMVYRDLLGDNDRAVELMSLYNLQNDSMKREMQAVKVAKNEAVYGQEQEQNARSEARNQRTVMLVVLAVIVVVAVLSVRVLRRQLRKTEAKAESRMTQDRKSVV